MVDVILEGGVILLVVVAVVVGGFGALICIMSAYFEIKDWFWWKVTYRVHERTAKAQKIIDSVLEKRPHGERTMFAERTLDSVSKKAPPPVHKSQAHSRPDRARLTTTTSTDFANMDLPTALKQLRRELEDSTRCLKMTQRDLKTEVTEEQGKFPKEG